ncbi:dipeptide/oligopeptide/nickel ABC transporter ATP-binding protein [Paenibacillus antibioticophila]|uniref:Dipeptide/oligopeptide/nickel ABC transporter ATP-binding protein n=1 Tax=Paenibacillus antibioticophila TaxID=1274374 RepID=A0A920CFW2_9BACL|nr:ABC transporter ATP-binding protein [Paenibacillus antibioticophila]GIO38651.1 dipeptide/oligopeptide/nickel ABC transporter ATP-binding protein [Paenibacillus antibioticophila]
MTVLLEVEQLQVTFKTEKGNVAPVENVDFCLNEEETIAIVGESGSGKSVTTLSIMGLLDKTGEVSRGAIRFKGKELTKLPTRELNRIRGNEISMIFQEPMSALNPVLTIGKQLTEQIRKHKKLSRGEAREESVVMLRKVGISRAESVMKEFPFSLSGGMLQRVMIAMAMSCSPQILIADEPTTALDVTIQAQILQLMKELKQELGTSILLITHDMNVVAEMADKVIVMYGGEVVEEADVFRLFEHHLHPYTQGLLSCIPRIGQNRSTRLKAIPGTVPLPQHMPTGCRFQDRCPHVTSRCREEHPPLLEHGQGHRVRCWLAGQEKEEAKSAHESSS